MWWPTSTALVKIVIVSIILILILITHRAFMHGERVWRHHKRDHVHQVRISW